MDTGLAEEPLPRRNVAELALDDPLRPGEVLVAATNAGRRLLDPRSDLSRDLVVASIVAPGVKLGGGAAGFWQAGIVGLALASALVTVYFFKVSAVKPLPRAGQ